MLRALLYAALVQSVFLSNVARLQESSTFVTTETHAGEARGYRVDTPSGGHLDMYLGIPYAEAPVGDLRFAPPVEKKRWRPSVFNATAFGAVCPQPFSNIRDYVKNGIIDMKEDCLNLNIYAPVNTGHANSLYPVMVWIHGGYFFAGSGSGYDGRILASRGEVVVVTVNFRLGALGSLSTADSNASGNQALLDQVLALKWVQRNIRSFGGDPSRVTIFGESTGGARVSLHMFSPLSKGLFQGIIAQSGNALSPFSMKRPPYSQIGDTRALAQTLGCPALTNRGMVECLRTKSAQDIAEVEIKHPIQTLPYSPRVDGYFLHDTPENLLKRGEFNHDVRVMTGFVQNEATIFLPQILTQTDELISFIYISMLDTASAWFYHKDDVGQALLCQYPASNNSKENMKTFISLVSDYEFRIPHIQLSAELNRQGVNTWLYQYNFMSENYPKPKSQGVYHGSELYMEFGAPLFYTLPCPGLRNTTCPQTWETNSTCDEADKKISNNVMDIWSSFAKLSSKNDTSLILPNGEIWNLFDDKKQFLNINSTLEIRNHPRQQVLALWEQFDYFDFYADPANPCANKTSL